MHLSSDEPSLRDPYGSTGKVDDELVSFHYEAQAKRLSFQHKGVLIEVVVENIIVASNQSPDVYRITWRIDEERSGIARNQTRVESHPAVWTIQDVSSESPSKSQIGCLTLSGLPQAFVQDFESYQSIDNDQQRVHVVVSVASGTREAHDFYKNKLLPAMIQNGHRHHSTYLTTSEDTVAELTKNIFVPNAVRGKRQLILLLSGDGGVLDVLNTLISSNDFEHRVPKTYRKPAIAIFPLGTGNALSNSLQITSDDTMGISTYLNGNAKSLPIFKAKFSPGSRLLAREANDALPLIDDSFWGCVVCSWGLHASLVADSDTTEYRKHGVQRFALAAKENLYPDGGDGQPHKYLGTVSVLRKGNSSTWQALERKEHAYLLATLVSRLEKTFTISPSSRPLDGQLRLVHFGPMSGDEAMDIMKAAYDGGKHVQDPRVGYEDIEGLRIDFHEEEDEKWRRVCVDGKIIRVEEGGWVELKVENTDVLDVLCIE